MAEETSPGSRGTFEAHTGKLRVAELFAGVGGFRIGLQRSGHQVVWSNQWEPGKRAQYASDCYVRHFGPAAHVNSDIHSVRAADVADHDLLVEGFPCQDYSVAATLDKSGGISGKKGVLWWQIVRILRKKRPSYVLLENVDRILRSPASQRGRDFGMMLRCLGGLGYTVEWRVVNAADYGFPQRRRRTFIMAAREDTFWGNRVVAEAGSAGFLEGRGFFAEAFPVARPQALLLEALHPDVRVPAGKKQLSDSFEFHFRNAGALVKRCVWTRQVQPRVESSTPLGSVLQSGVDSKYLVPPEQLARWEYFKGAKREFRTAKNGHRYHYTEGGMAFPDDTKQPARTILTGEGGSPNRSNHIIRDPISGDYRRLTPVECELLNGFPAGWTEGMPDRWRYFTMGNALVVGLVERMGAVFADGPRAREPLTVAQ